MLSAADITSELDRLDALTPAPFGVNFIVPFLDPECLDIAARRARVVEFFWGTPDPELVAAGGAGGALVSWQVGSAAEAVAAVAAGVDLVVLQGVEGGGHIRGEAALAGELAAALELVEVPLLAAGGIHDAAGIRAVLARGASGARLGTVFVAATESGAHPDYKAALVAARSSDTTLTGTFHDMWPDAPHRVLKQSIDNVEALNDADLADGAIGVTRFGSLEVPVSRYSVIAPTAATTGRVEAMAHYAGYSVDGIDDVRAAAEIMADLTEGLG